MSIKELIKIKLLGYRATSESYIKHLRSVGMSIGEDVMLFRPFNTTIDEQNPHMVSIGNHVMITGPVTILSHDYSWSVIKGKYGDIVGNQRKTVIGDNVFIGWGATLLGGVQVGDNVIIGAGSVVSGMIESDSVYAGNPAKRIMSVEEFYIKRLERQLNEAKEFVLEYQKLYGKIPEEKELKEYFYLFASEDGLCTEYISQIELLGNKELSLKRIKERKKFKNYKEFIAYCVR